MMIIPNFVSTVLLFNPFFMHFPEKGFTNIITYGALQEETFVWNYIAVSDSVDFILLDIKQAF